MSNPDLEVLKADVETLCDLVVKIESNYWSEDPIAPDLTDALEIVGRIRRILDSPTDVVGLQQSRRMNKDPKSNRDE